MISVYNNLTNNEINVRRLETIEKYNKIIQWGRRNPIHFIDQFMGIQLLDYQKWALLNTWVAQKAVWLCSRATGKTFLAAVYMMAKGLLFPQYAINLMNVTAKQNFETFKKIEDIAKKNIITLAATTDVFINELEKSNNSDGFTHKQIGHECKLFNGSYIRTVVGKADTVVGVRSNLNFYDESGKIPHKFFDLTEPFTVQKRGFVTGRKGFDMSLLPLDIPNQHLYASSAEDTDSHLFKQYKLAATKMIMGIPGYFCADLSCEFPLRPMMNGMEFPPLLTQEEIDNAMQNNETKALREYYNLFDNATATNAVIRRADIIRNEGEYLPHLQSAGKDKHYVICYDPAGQGDNSFALIGEVYKDPKKGYLGRIVHGVNFVEKLSSGIKVPLRAPEQLEAMRKLILAFNGDNPEYTNVFLYIDGGAGGHGRTRADFLRLSWTDSNGKEHKGVIDLNDPNTKETAYQYPNAIHVVHIVNPKAEKANMYAATEEMITNDYITFTPAAPRTNEIILDEQEHSLTTEEMLSLIELDLMKEEIVNIVKTKRPSGDYSYDLSVEKKHKMKDDRADTLSYFAWHLKQIREDEAFFFGSDNSKWSDFLANNTQKAGKKVSSPFANMSNPFKR